MDSTHSSQLTLYCPICEASYRSGDRCPKDGTRLVELESASDPHIGRSIDGRYTLEARLGQGSIGTVYRATQHSIGRLVAVKMVSPVLAREPTVIKRFLREAKLSSRLSHPNAVAVLDFGQTTDRLFYVVTEFLEGRNLAEVLAEDGPFPVERLVRVGSQICDALDAAHRMGIVHRDLKPSNIIILDKPSGRDFVKVLDFGMAKSLASDETATALTVAGGIVGTPLYLPPEAVLGAELDARADLYSLGCILYELGCGHAPHDAKTVQELIMLHSYREAPPLPGGSAPLAALLARMLSKNPADRPVSAAAVRAELMTIGGKARSTRPASARSQPHAAAAPADADAVPGGSAGKSAAWLAASGAVSEPPAEAAGPEAAGSETERRGRRAETDGALSEWLVADEEVAEWGEADWGADDWRPRRWPWAVAVVAAAAALIGLVWFQTTRSSGASRSSAAPARTATHAAHPVAGSPARRAAATGTRSGRAAVGAGSAMGPPDAGRPKVAAAQTAAKPVKTAAKPVKTAAKPAKTAAKPVKTAAKPVKTAAKPVKTAVKPAKTAVKPAKTAAKPVKTAAKPTHAVHRRRARKHHHRRHHHHHPAPRHRATEYPF